MENAVDALKIAFGVLVFVIALTVAFALLSQAKATSDIMLFASDKTNYYTYSENAENEAGRIVGADVVISSKKRVNEWIKDPKNDLTGDFLETFDEVKKSGEYIVEDDGSELTVQSGQTSIYITYKKQ